VSLLDFSRSCRATGVHTSIRCASKDRRQSCTCLCASRRRFGKSIALHSRCRSRQLHGRYIAWRSGIWGTCRLHMQFNEHLFVTSAVYLPPLPGLVLLLAYKGVLHPRPCAILLHHFCSLIPKALRQSVMSALSSLPPKFASKPACPASCSSTQRPQATMDISSA
jgi:hypothetical protein